MEKGSSGEDEGIGREEGQEEEGGLVDLASDTSDPVDIENFSLLEKIQAIAAYNARAPLNNEKQVILFLKSWWSRTYNRPLKDPLLDTYTVEELMYEFYDNIERTKAANEASERDNDRIEEDKDKAAMDWAEMEEKRELDNMELRANSDKTSDPTKDPSNIAWMEEKLKEAKAVYGEDFGEDIEDNFNE
jgi:hypothetical protein